MRLLVGEEQIPEKMTRAGHVPDAAVIHGVRAAPLGVAAHVEDLRRAAELGQQVVGSRDERWIDVRSERSTRDRR